MKIKQKHWERAGCGGKLPRKIKKFMIGKKVSKSQLKNIIKSYKTGDATFCPECGCSAARFYDHGVPYPEVWADFICLRCGYIVATADNSEMTYVFDQMR